MQFKFFVGIDVSKDTLDFSVVAEGKELDVFKIENSPKALKAAVKQIFSLKDCGIKSTLFCLEQTGLYNNHVTTVLHSMVVIFG
jgi:transposase